MVHSAIAAIIDATERWTKDGISGSTLYTTLFPANRDAQMCVDYGITTVVFIDDIYKDKPFTKASKIIMEKSDIKIRYLIFHCVVISHTLVMNRRLDKSKFEIPPSNYIVN